jgi:hypothetical protein
MNRHLTLQAYHRRLEAEAAAEAERQRARQATMQFAREHPIITSAAIALLIAALLKSRD